jgi:phage FluMu protein Com
LNNLYDKKNLCAECAVPAIGYIPFEDGERFLCEAHFDKAAHAGYFTCKLGTKVCPDCKGCSWKSKTVKCATCRNTGVVAGSLAAGKKPCSRCKGTGFIYAKGGRPAYKA